jgi:hypothetical protein
MLPDNFVGIVCIGVVIGITILLKCSSFCAVVYSRYQERGNPGAEGRDSEAYAAGCGHLGDLVYCMACTVPCKTCCRSKNGHGIVD